MSLSEQDVQSMQLAYYFIKNCHYQFIASKDIKDEIWLGNPQNKEYPVIRISKSRISSVFFDKTRILQIHDTVKHLFSCGGDLLDIHLSDEAVQEQEDQIETVTISPDSLSEPKLISVFPGLSSVVSRIEDPKAEMEKITKKLSELQQQKIRETRKSALKPPKATMVIMGICIAVFVLSMILNALFRGMAEPNELSVAVSIVLGSYYKAFVVGAGEYWRFFTSAFVHTDIFHLLMNMMALYNMGMLCERFMGTKNFLITLFVSILFGSAFVYLGSGNVVAMGISGGLYGLLAAFLVFGIQTRILFQPQLRTQFILIVLINIMISLMPGVSLAAHAGGFVGGLLVSMMLTKNDSWKQLRKNTVVAFCVAALFLGMKIADPKSRDLDAIYGGTDQMVVSMLSQIHLDSYSDYLNRKMTSLYIDLQTQEK